MIQPQTARDLQLRLLPVQQAPKCCPARWLCRACGQCLVEIDQPSWHKLLGAAKLSVSKSHEASPGGTGWVGSSQVLGWFFPSAAPNHACPAEHGDGWCCCAWCDHHCAVTCPCLSPALLTGHLPSLPKCLHLPMAFPCLTRVFPAPVVAHAVPSSVVCVFTDSTEHVCFAELLSPLNQDELSGVAVALQSSR